MLSRQPRLFNWRNENSVPETNPLVRELLHETERYDLNLVRVQPGAGPNPHASDTYGFVLVLEGSVEFTVDGETYPLAQGQGIAVPTGAVRGFKAGSAGGLLLAGHVQP